MTETTPTHPAPADAAAALLAANRRRRSIRRWVAIGTLPLTLAALLFVGKLLSMYAFAHTSISSFVTGGYAESESAARGQDFLNWFEQYKAPYNIGTALAGAEKLPEARAELERALPLASGLEACPVLINLSLVVERQGDAAMADGDAARAAELYGEALQITVDTPEECNDQNAQEQSPDPNRDMSDTLDQNQERQREKQQQSQQDPEQNQQPQQPDESDQQDQPSQSDLDDIEKRLNQGAQEREDQLDGDQGGSGGGTDKPW
jgi:tetratricopeptide (TPR) repeat protein